ncbi:MAG: hypothetical protein RI556_13135 [Hydrogenovibrio sp.]|uniref:hypothetical protein n=1 Tax=Hydrogenovibrio sp. TaxID=2065821 RepID=UPI0028702511|nr:hypothetical protein [Hydrogenovibrio sp.]MDR9500115.1 hypothetical protein [Hydrogenovibrio sp.]
MTTKSTPQKERIAWLWLTPNQEEKNCVVCSSPWFHLPKITLNLTNLPESNPSFINIAGAEVAEALCLLMSQHSGVIIYLDERLPDTFQLFNWEALQYETEAPDNNVLFVRYAHLSHFTQNQDHNVGSRYHFFDLFPASDWPPGHYPPKPFYSGNAAWQALKREDLGKFSRITVFSHGDEDGESLIKLHNNKSAHLNHINHWPESLWLLACGEANGKHLKFVSELIKNHQVEWGLTSNGKINAKHALILNNRLNEAILHNKDLLATLLETRKQYPQIKHVITAGKIPIINQTDQLTSFFNKQTLLLLENKTSLNQILQKLYVLENVKDYNVEQESALLKKIEQLFDSFPKITRQLTVLPVAVFIAERSVHSELDWLVNQIENTNELPSGTTLLGLAKGFLRTGKDIAALKTLSKIPVKSYSSKYFDTFLTIFLICSDLHLLPYNYYLSQIINLMNNSGDLTLEQENKWLGAKAIFSFEQGHTHVALNETLLKHKKDISTNQNLPDYEASDILYYSSLLSFSNRSFDVPTEFLTIELRRLGHRKSLIRSIGSKAGGSRTIKALGLYGWLKKDISIQLSIEEVLREIERNYSLHSLDIGPLGFSNAFLLLSRNSESLDWYHSPYRTLMIDKQYLFETAMLDFLFGLDDDAEQLLLQFETIRESAINQLNSMALFKKIKQNQKYDFTSPHEWVRDHLHLSLEERLNILIPSGFFPN